MEQFPNSFWQANFWGIVGTVSGLLGLLVSWFNFKYNTPDIQIDKMYLVVPDWVTKDWKDKTINDFKNSFLDFELEIMVRNKRGGAGSIDKPNLLIKIPNGNKYYLFRRYKQVSLPPETQHTESKRESENITSTWTVRHGRAFNLGGGEKADENLEYSTDKPEQLYQIIQNFENLTYFIEYWDNFGKRHEKMIKRIVKESEQDN